MPQASSTPAGFHSATPYQIFDGTAADAIAFYRDVFAATEPTGRLTDPAGRILDAAILIGDSVIRVGDEAPWQVSVIFTGSATANEKRETVRYE